MHRSRTCLACLVLLLLGMPPLPGAASARTLATTPLLPLKKPHIVLDPKVGNQGTTVKVRGQRFHANDVVTLSWEDSAGKVLVPDLAKGITDSHGGWGNGAGSTPSITFTVPPASIGQYLVHAADTRGTTADARFRVPPTELPCSPTQGQAGTFVRFSALSFGGNENVDVHWASQTDAILDTITTNALGDGSGTGTIPKNAIPGVYTILGYGRTTQQWSQISCTFTVD